MYLKSIEVQGFKSFANKIKFEFHNGITGIVGPNGSGKSNVADAVRWVLGEQRIKQLRGGKMEDVIFAGTQNRKPLGFAYVAITLDNSDKQLAVDFDEVTVARRLYRSGESEYLINGAICRLKDVHELFYDTGIGKEGYSIIGQGQIDKILSGKPEEKRELFDEAAGIVKFKRRKLEAIKKLENQRQNLTRVSDILSELEKQVGPLSRQSETARTYLKLKEELKSYDINLFLLEIGAIRKQLAEVDDKYAIAQNDFEESKEALEEIKNKYDELDKFIEDLDNNLEEMKNKLNEVNLTKEKLEGEVKVLNEQINSDKINDTHYKNRIDAINEEINSKNTEKKAYLEEKEQLKDMSKNAESLKADADSKVAVYTKEVEDLSEQVEGKKNDIINLLNEKAGVSAKIQRYDTMLEQINLRKAELNQKLVKSKSDATRQEEIINELTEELKEVNAKIIEITDEQNAAEDKLNEIKRSTDELFKNKNAYDRQYNQAVSQLETLKNITERYEGYGNSIKKIMELKETKKGIIGVVADIIKVDKKYEVAIETALGGNIQNVVTDNEITAKEAIEFLKQGKYGRATFLPLSSIANKTGFTNDRVFEEKGVIGLASDLVTIKKEYENISKFLLGRIVVADTIDNALSLARKYNYTLRIVTLEGELLNAGGSMSGGAFKNNSNLLGRRRELQELEKLIEELKVKMSDTDKQIAKNAELKKVYNEELEQIKITLNEQFLVQNTVKMNLNTADEKKNELSNIFDDFNREKDEIGAQIVDINANYEALKTELDTFDERNKLIENEIIELNGKIEAAKEQESNMMKDNEELRINLSNLNQKKTFINDNIDRIDAEISKLNEEIESINENRKIAAGQADEKYANIEAINKTIEAAVSEADVLKTKIDELSKDKDSQSKEHKEFFAKREEITDLISNLDKEIYRLSNQKEKLEESNEKFVNYMWEEYELTYGTALELKNEELGDSTANLRKNISSLKSQIKNLGSVNVNAIEEYKEVSERYEFLKTQHDDLITAENSLLKIIEELDDGMKKQFTEKFAEIKVEFDKVFKELFGGGQGTIELNDDEDILEAGINIISQPPGKKLQNMMQLSGGEKALTAIALLFAIQNLKPSPFCLLDEIEAALDDSNVVRFAEYLHKLTDHTQFIVITHRRGTMNASDRLYGITMQEKGVSTLVSVNLIDEKNFS
ncbi:MAG: chromosome segregation protein SMC [Lachnospiraceae bacterium]|nr:chromosome segregation protein SMC [Lachnospiraceae bacterium]